MNCETNDTFSGPEELNLGPLLIGEVNRAGKEIRMHTNPASGPRKLNAARRRLCSLRSSGWSTKKSGRGRPARAANELNLGTAAAKHGGGLGHSRRLLMAVDVNQRNGSASGPLKFHAARRHQWSVKRRLQTSPRVEKSDIRAASEILLDNISTFARIHQLVPREKRGASTGLTQPGAPSPELSTLDPGIMIFLLRTQTYVRGKHQRQEVRHVSRLTTAHILSTRLDTPSPRFSTGLYGGGAAAGIERRSKWNSES